jgi:Ulp1 family protease
MKGQKAIHSADKLITNRNKPTIEKVLCSSIATLISWACMNNEVINYVCRVLIAPQQKTKQPKVHIYQSFFMSRLHNKGAETEGYNFKAVRKDDSRIDGDRAALDKLYIPINVDNTHWILIGVAINAKTIQLFGS